MTFHPCGTCTDRNFSEHVSDLHMHPSKNAVFLQEGQSDCCWMSGGIAGRTDPLDDWVCVTSCLGLLVTQTVPRLKWHAPLGPPASYASLAAILALIRWGCRGQAVWRCAAMINVCACERMTFHRRGETGRHYLRSSCEAQNEF